VEDVVKSPSDENGNEPLDLSTWDPQLPPDGFADRVLAQVTEKSNAPVPITAARPRSRRRAIAWVGAGVAAMALAAGLVLGVGASGARGASGEAIAKDRIEVALGSRALAVLEPGASVRWNGDDVTQAKGDVFYRVERGSKFVVHTPAGDVEVKGTCFTVKVRAPEETAEQKDETMQKRDVKSGLVGGALTALAFVAVYEGKVGVSHASEHADLTAGESAQMGPKGVSKSDAKAFEKAAAEAQAPDEPLMTANQRLAHQVGEYRSRLESVTAEKSELEQKLKRSEQSLAATQDGSTAVKNPYDLTEDDYKQMAKEGSLKYQLPCIDPHHPWTPSAERLSILGLSPQDGDTLKNAYARSSKQIWDTIKPLCTQVVGTPDLADKFGPDLCMRLVLENSAKNGALSDATTSATKAVAEMRAGMRPVPGPNEDVPAPVQILLAATGANKSLEKDLAQSFGPEEAHRLVFSGELCMSQSSYRTSPKKKGGSAADDALDDVTR
jgi:ferric-dicitrate binding protein FerR (iron transport regulator)